MTRRVRPLRRTHGTREERQRILIYCEGERTEVSYLKGVRKELRDGNVRIVIGPEHTEPLGLVKAAIDHHRRAPDRPEDQHEPYDQVWCVFDVEAPKPHANLDAALQRAHKHGVRRAPSNPCFELWLLLHFGDQTSYLSNKEAQKTLEDCSCGYSRRTKQVNYDSLRDKRLDARERAIRLDQRQREPAKAVGRNPWTSVHVLVDALFGAA